MRHRRNAWTLVLADLKDLHHEGNFIVRLEPFRNGFTQYRRRERPKRLTPFDLRVEDRLHVTATRIAHDGSIAERTRPPLHASLKPTHHTAVGHGARRSRAQLPFVAEARHLTTAG